jgi:hypothetical protein
MTRPCAQPGLTISRIPVAPPGWVDGDCLSDNQGPILGMIANYKTGIIWNATRKVPTLVRGLQRAGFAERLR